MLFRHRERSVAFSLRVVVFVLNVLDILLNGRVIAAQRFEVVLHGNREAHRHVHRVVLFGLNSRLLIDDSKRRPFGLERDPDVLFNGLKRIFEDFERPRILLIEIGLLLITVYSERLRSHRSRTRGGRKRPFRPVDRP